MKAEINTDNIFLVSQDTGEKISLKGVKTISTEDLKYESPIDDIKTGIHLLKSGEVTFMGEGLTVDRKTKNVMDVEIRKQQLYGMYERMKRNIEIAELMGWRTIESEIAIKCIMTELEMLGVDIKHIKEMVL